MASPLSVGDCIAIIGVIVKCVDAVCGSSDDAKALEGLKGDLAHMRESLEELLSPSSAWCSASHATLGRLNSTIDRCRDALRELATLTEKYGPRKSRFATFYSQITWAISGKTKVAPIQCRIQNLTAALLLIQGDIIRQTIDDLGASGERGNRRLARQLHQSKEEVKYHIYAAIDEPWDQKPIRFQDAMGRRFPVPLEICRRFSDFLEFLAFSFKGHDLLPFVAHKNIWLFTPSENGSRWWYLIHEGDWAAAARPGVKLGMSIFREHVWQPPNMYSSISLSRPIPPWSTLPENLEFRWWSQPPLSGPISMEEPRRDPTIDPISDKSGPDQGRDPLCEGPAVGMESETIGRPTSKVGLDPRVHQAFLRCLRVEDLNPYQFCLACDKQIVGAAYCSKSCKLSNWSITGKHHDQNPRLSRTLDTRNENDDNPRAESEGDFDRNFDVDSDLGLGWDSDFECEFDWREFCDGSDTGDWPRG
ncbi:uncharacterized protein B0T15DRAFT_314824 [Chaetomium strumarium]|uniref:Ubiquitin-like domain-containing protein n=1 Tax=Chaetomium strumarium TaxID=1170767 RepID=A0AAJ0LYV3_9PEZI|nr:hypothetical protein B0T15DRAFT_314824 [Chaetomium strumarium]